MHNGEQNKSRSKRLQEAATAPFGWFFNNVISPIASFVTTQYNNFTGFVGRVFRRATPATGIDAQSPAAPLVAAAASQPRFPRISNFVASFSNPFAGMGARFSSYLFKTKEVQAQQPEVEQPQVVQTQQDEVVQTQQDDVVKVLGVPQDEVANALEAPQVEEIRQSHEAQQQSTVPTTAVVDTKDKKAANDSRRSGVVASLNSARKGLGLTGYRLHSMVYGQTVKQQQEAVGEQRKSTSPRNSNA